MFQYNINKMKPDIDSFIDYIIKFMTTLKSMLFSITGVPILIASWFFTLSDAEKGIWTLVVVLFFDFITGCWASWVEHKKNNEKVTVYFIETSKIRLSLVKLATYFFLILFGWLLTDIFFNKPIQLFLSHKQFAFSELVIGACVAVEIYSNIENFKRAGFDILGKLTGFIKRAWGIFNVIKTGKEE